MRPITLKMAGLRSYRTERTIDFGDPGLIAVIGDTGAGKSSILEALTGALYGACTWDNRGIGELISDGAQTVQLELTFAVAGQTWTSPGRRPGTTTPRPGISCTATTPARNSPASALSPAASPACWAWTPSSS